MTDLDALMAIKVELMHRGAPEDHSLVLWLDDRINALAKPWGKSQNSKWLEHQQVGSDT